MHPIFVAGKNAELGPTPIQDAAKSAHEIQAFDARSFPTPIEGSDDVGNMILLTVLAPRRDGKIKAYAGIVPDTSRQDPQYRAPAQWVRAYGNPLRYAEARAIWPGLEPREYAA